MDETHLPLNPATDRLETGGEEIEFAVEGPPDNDTDGDVVPEYEPEDDPEYRAFLEREQARGPLAFAPHELDCQACWDAEHPDRYEEWRALEAAQAVLVYGEERGARDHDTVVDVPKWAQDEVEVEPELSYGQLRLIAVALDVYLRAEAAHPLPKRKVVAVIRPKVAQADPSEAYRLECGHVAI